MVNRLDSLSRTCCFHSSLYTMLTAPSRLASLSVPISQKSPVETNLAVILVVDTVAVIQTFLGRSGPVDRCRRPLPTSAPVFSLPTTRRSLVEALLSTGTVDRCRRRLPTSAPGFPLPTTDWSKRCCQPAPSRYKNSNSTNQVS